ncbi:MAG: hypothetical protein P8H56_11335 [Crocinitomicaceae bacterium]|nr:hypothetical protein [Crocinitomicaceae bacterium]
MVEKETINPTPKKKKRTLLLITSAVLLVVICIVVYFSYYFVYSEGSRVGILYKFSKKGTIFKTYEGAMVLPGVKSQKGSSVYSNMFYFSVDDEKLAKKLIDSQGMELEVHYNQFNNGLPWRGDT